MTTDIIPKGLTSRQLHVSSRTMALSQFDVYVAACFTFNIFGRGDLRLTVTNDMAEENHLLLFFS